jgi:rubredoxin
MKGRVSKLLIHLSTLFCIGFKKIRRFFDLFEKYTCAVCGHMFDPEKGEPLQNIPPGREFADLLETWQCPICGASKKNFRKE